MAKKTKNKSPKPKRGQNGQQPVTPRTEKLEKMTREQRKQARADKRKQQKKAKAAEARKDLPPALTKGKALFQGQLHPKKLKKIHRIEQWVEVRVRDGVVTTTLYPSNEKLILRGQRMLPPPEYVYRRINFPDGIPSLYDWVGVIDEAHCKHGGCGIQRITVDTWISLVEREKQEGNGHILPVANLPRPRESGGCECPTCCHNQALLDQGLFAA